MLFEYGADTRAVSGDGFQVLHSYFAALADMGSAESYPKLVEFLLGRGASFEDVSKDGEPWPMVGLALLAGVEPACLSLLLDHGGDSTSEWGGVAHVGTQSMDFKRWGGLGYNLLHLTAQEAADPEIFRLLLEGGADPTAMSQYDEKPCGVFSNYKVRNNVDTEAIKTLLCTEDELAAPEPDEARFLKTLRGEDRQCVPEDVTTDWELEHKVQSAQFAGTSPSTVQTCLSEEGQVGLFKLMNDQPGTTSWSDSMWGCLWESSLLWERTQELLGPERSRQEPALTIIFYAQFTSCPSDQDFDAKLATGSNPELFFPEARAYFVCAVDAAGGWEDFVQTLVEADDAVELLKELALDKCGWLEGWLLDP